MKRQRKAGILALIVSLASSTAPHAGPDPARLDPAHRFARERHRGLVALAPLTARPAVRVHWQAHRMRPSLILGLESHAPGATPVEQARAFLTRHPDLFGRPADLRATKTRRTPRLTVVRFQQLHQGIEVDGATLSVGIDTNGMVRMVRSDVEPIHLPSNRPRISPSHAAGAAFTALNGPNAGTPALAPRSATLVILSGPTPLLAYRVFLPASADPLGRWHLVDASTGRYLGSRPGVLWHLRTAAAEVGR